ncbi:hypothetical protein [Paenibacillus taichungensis]|nr:hypothetical protein [Paenibacillus taichungensis]
MYNDWEVLHLHLGDQPDTKNSKFVKRTNELLFLILNQNSAYFINVLTHNGNWTNRSLLQIVYNNWPELINPYIINGAVGLAWNYTNEQHFRLRKAGYNVIMELRDSSGKSFVIGPPGQGITASGNSLKDSTRYDDIISEILRIEHMVMDNISVFLDVCSVSEPIKLKLVIISNDWFVEEQSSGNMWKLEKVC